MITPQIPAYAGHRKAGALHHTDSSPRLVGRHLARAGAGLNTRSWQAAQSGSASVGKGVWRTSQGEDPEAQTRPERSVPTQKGKGDPPAGGGDARSRLATGRRHRRATASALRVGAVVKGGLAAHEALRATRKRLRLRRPGTGAADRRLGRRGRHFSPRSCGSTSLHRDSTARADIPARGSRLPRISRTPLDAERNNLVGDPRPGHHRHLAEELCISTLEASIKSKNYLYIGRLHADGGSRRPTGHRCLATSSGPRTRRKIKDAVPHGPRHRTRGPVGQPRFASRVRTTCRGRLARGSSISIPPERESTTLSPFQQAAPKIASRSTGSTRTT